MSPIYISIHWWNMIDVGYGFILTVPQYDGVICVWVAALCCCHDKKYYFVLFVIMFVCFIFIILLFYIYISSCILMTTKWPWFSWLSLWFPITMSWLSLFYVFSPFFLTILMNFFMIFLCLLLICDVVFTNFFSIYFPPITTVAKMSREISNP